MSAAGHPSDDAWQSRGIVTVDLGQGVAKDAAVNKDLAPFRQGWAVGILANTGMKERFCDGGRRL